MQKRLVRKLNECIAGPPSTRQIFGACGTHTRADQLQDPREVNSTLSVCQLACCALSDLSGRIGYASTSLRRKVCFARSYTPKKMAPPMLIQITLGTIPLNSVLGPSSLAMRAIVLTKFEEYGTVALTAAVLAAVLCLLLSMMRVLATSSGVVSPAAIPPAKLPHIAEYLAGRSSTRVRPSVCFATMAFKRS